MGGTTHSYLDGLEWVLRTRVSRAGESGVTITHDAFIRATARTRAKWNAYFWSLFPSEPARFRALVETGQINVKVMFRFRPTARMKQSYGGQPVLKVGRAAEGWRDQLDRLPAELAAAIEDYDRDRRMLERQRQQAWSELLHVRLPTPPAGHTWSMTSGDPRFYGDLLNFRLKLRG